MSLSDRLRFRCLYLGEHRGDVPCGCDSNQTVKVFECLVFGLCSLKEVRDVEHNCRGCGQFVKSTMAHTSQIRKTPDA